MLTAKYYQSMANLPNQPEDVRSALLDLTTPQIRALAELSGLSAPALLKVKYGQIENPGIFTVAKFWRNIKAVKDM